MCTVGFNFSRFCWLPGVLFLTVLGVSGVARAELPAAQAEALVLWDDARAVWEQGNHERAEELLRQSFARWPSYHSACDLARLFRERRQTADAIEWYDRCAQQTDADTEQRERARAEARALRDRTGQLALTGGVEGAAIFIDGAFYRRVPVEEPIDLVTGPHELMMVDRDGASMRRNVEVRPAQVTAFELPTEIEPERAGLRSSPHRVPMWTVWMMAAVTLATAVGAFVTYGLDFQASSEPGEEDRAATMRIVSAVLGGVAGASFGVTMILLPYALRSRAHERTEAAGQAARWSLSGPYAGGWW